MSNSQSVSSGGCGESCEIYSRVTGYHRPLKNWNEGKQEEFKGRLMFEVPLVGESLPTMTSISSEEAEEIKNYIKQAVVAK